MVKGPTTGAIGNVRLGALLVASGRLPAGAQGRVVFSLENAWLMEPLLLGCGLILLLCVTFLLWSRDRRGPVRTIMPYFNRTVVFSTTDSSFHGHPHPLTCPAGVSRKSVSLYYYSNGRPDAEKSSPHDTIFLPGNG